MSSPAVSRYYYRFGVFEVDLRAGALRKRGSRIRIQGQPLRVLAALLERPGELVTRDELRTRLWSPDMFVDFEHGLNASMTRLRQALGDNARSPRFIETVARTGYRFIAAVERDGGLAVEPLRAEAGPPGSVAVLPFANLSPDPDCDFFGDGLTEEITHALARVPQLQVVARTSASQFRDGPQDVRTIGAQLGVRMVLAGSVRKAAGRIRVAVQLIKVKDGYHLWSEVFERDLTDIFALQDEIALAVAEATQPHAG